MTTENFIKEIGNQPLLAAAIHNGHEVSKNVSDLFLLNDTERLREEDPFTEIWTQVTDTRIVVPKSRFEIDLNRPRDKAVYLKPEDAWGLNIWKTQPDEEIIKNSLEYYDDFYSKMLVLLKKYEARFGKFVVFDIHSYNHLRNGPNEKPASPEENPEVNIGTGTMNRDIWAPVIDRFLTDLKNYDFQGRHLDVRENVKFRGGNFSRWIHENFPRSGCSIAIEFKKFFMDEWTGKPDNAIIEDLKRALRSTVPGVLEELKKL